MRAHLQGWATAVLVGGMAWLILHGGAFAATDPAQARQLETPRIGGFDREALQRELSRSARELQGQPGEVLRAHVDRLVELNAALELAEDVPPSERRALGDHILARVAQIGLLLRSRVSERPAEPPTPGKAAKTSANTLPQTLIQTLTGPLAENSGLLLGVLGGLVVTFSLGRLVGYRRGILQASYYGEGDPRIRFLARPATHAGEPGERVPVTLAQVREALAAGRTVLLQMGYEISPARRERFLQVTREVQGLLSVVEGQTYTVWEDPKHPNRFYEVLVCRRLAALSHLSATDGPLARLAEELEACRLDGGPVLRRAWWGVLPDPGWLSGGAPFLEASLAR